MATEIRYGEIAMMGEQTGLQPKIFYLHMNLVVCSGIRSTLYTPANAS